MTLFVRGNFVSRSGVALSWKIEVDALTADDWACLAEIYTGLARGPDPRVPPFGKVIGIAGGAVPFAIALRQYVTAGAPGLLVADDVLTIGESFRIALGALNPLERERARSVVAFDRSQPLPVGVFALFSLNVTRIAR